MNLGEFLDNGLVALGATDSTTRSQLLMGTVRAIDTYKSQRFSWNRIRWELTTTSGTAFYDEIGQVDSGDTFTASQVFKLDSAFYVESGRNYKVDIIGFEKDALGLNDDAFTGKPSAIAVGAQQFLVVPEPDDEYVLQGLAVVDVNKTTGSYTAITTSAGNSSENPWLEHADRMLQAKALAEVFLFYRRDPKWAAVYENAANQEFQRHVQDYERREGAGRVKGYHSPSHGDQYGYFRF